MRSFWSSFWFPVIRLDPVFQIRFEVFKDDRYLDLFRLGEDPNPLERDLFGPLFGTEIYRCDLYGPLASAQRQMCLTWGV